MINRMSKIGKKCDKIDKIEKCNNYCTCLVSNTVMKINGQCRYKKSIRPGVAIMGEVTDLGSIPARG